MATQTIIFTGPTGRTLTAKLFPHGSDTLQESVSATEATNRKGYYSAAFTDAPAGDYSLHIFEGANLIGVGIVNNLTLSTATFYEAEIANAIFIPGITSGGGGGTGTGANTITITVNDGTAVLENAKVRVTNGAESYLGTTNASGVVTFALDDATWSVAITKPGYQFTPTTLVVSATASQTYSMSAVTITPSAVSETTGYVTVTRAGVAVQGVTVELEVTKFANGTTGNGINNPRFSDTTDASGYAEFVGLPRLASYQVRINTATRKGEWFKGVTADASTTPLAGVLGLPE